MQINQDSAILNSASVDKNSNIPIINQALRIAIYDEMKAYETNMQIIEKFGEVEPFINIVEAEKRHYTMLLPLLEKYQVELPNDDYTQNIVPPQTLLEACEVGVANELENIKMYDNLLAETQNYPDVQEAFYILQAASYNNHLPAFRRNVQNFYNQVEQNQMQPNQSLDLNGMEQTIKQLEEFSNGAKDFTNGKFNQESIINLLNNKNISLLGGALLGALGAVLLTQTLSNKNDKLNDEGDK